MKMGRHRGAVPLGGLPETGDGCYQCSLLIQRADGKYAPGSVRSLKKVRGGLVEATYLKLERESSRAPGIIEWLLVRKLLGQQDMERKKVDAEPQDL